MTKASKSQASRTVRRVAKGKQKPSATRPAPSTKGKTVPSRSARRQAARIRRARIVLLGSIATSALILAAWFPVTSLLSQRQALGGANSQLAKVKEQNTALQRERRSLSSPTEIGRLAEQHYPLVKPGQQAYEVLPPNGSGAVVGFAGDPGRNDPVAPSATVELPPDSLKSTSAAGTAGHQGHKAVVAKGFLHKGFVGRMVQTLEFWN